MIGSEEWLKEMEQHYGGYHTNVPRNKISELTPDTDKAKLNPGGMSGGDRMSVHRYAKHYAKHLSRFVDNRLDPIVIVECGILKGTGLAVWSTLFPNAHIIGLDIDLSHTKNNMDFLKSQGAFQSGTLELYEYDQFADNRDLLAEILKNKKIDIAIDDGFHSELSILNTYNELCPYLNDDFCYFVEDNRTVYDVFVQKIKDLGVYRYKQLTVIDRCII
jgi:hypothetical protein